MSETGVDDGRPGVGRLHYFVGKVAIGVAMGYAAGHLDPDGWPMMVVGMLLSYAGFAIEVGRLRSIGLSRWYSVLRFVPYVNLLYMIFLQSAPAGWAETRQMDRAGKTLLIFQTALLILLILTMMRMGVSVPYFI